MKISKLDPDFRRGDEWVDEMPNHPLVPSIAGRVGSPALS